MDSINERGTTRILRLLDSLRRFQRALAIEEPLIRDRETLQNVTSLIKDITASYEWLVGTQRERASDLLEVLKRLSAYSQIHESITSALLCVEKSSKILREITREDEASYELDRLYKEFRDSINSLANRNLGRAHSYLKTTKLDLLTSSLENELVGDLLERYYVPELVRRMGYQLKSRVVPTSIGDVQVDVRAEKDEIGGFENLERHRKRKVLIVETKATVKFEDITSLSKKRKAILDNYRKESEIWKYEFTSETWMVACYGWNDRSKDHARRQNIIPIDDEELGARLLRYNLLDKGRPPCRKQPRENLQ